jgi:hypothetical protein
MAQSIGGAKSATGRSRNPPPFKALNGDSRGMSACTAVRVTPLESPFYIAFMLRYSSGLKGDNCGRLEDAAAIPVIGHLAWRRPEPA